MLNTELGQKQLELLHEIAPAAKIVALLLNPTGPNFGSVSKDVQVAARTLGLQIPVMQASTDLEFETAFANLIQLQAGALVIGPDPFFTSRLERLAALAIRQAVPTIYSNREFAVAGGLMSYGTSITDIYRLLGGYVSRILKGEKPTDLPVQQFTKVGLVINLKTARALGITVPTTLLGRADEVIE